MRRASLEYLDVWLGSAMSADPKQLVILCYVSCDGICFLDSTRGSDKLQSSQTLQWEEIIMRAIR
eukprot:4122333-Pyramimonas_sp.AAC.1